MATAPERLAGLIAGLEKRIRFLERTVYRTGRHDEVVFSKAGAANTDESNTYLMRGASKVIGAKVTAKVAATTDSVITVYVSGVAVGTITLLANAVYGEATFDDNTFANDETLYVACTTVGTGLSGVTVHVEIA